MSYLSAVKYAAPFFAGLLVMWLYHSATISGIEADAAKKEAQQVKTEVVQIKQDTQDNDANVFQYLEQITAANQEVTKLRDRLADGSISLRMCHADTIAARVSASNSSAAKDQARADLAAYQSDVADLLAQGKELDAWVESAHEFINRK